MNTYSSRAKSTALSIVDTVLCIEYITYVNDPVNGGSPGSQQRNVNLPHSSQWKNPRTLEGILPQLLA